MSRPIRPSRLGDPRRDETLVKTRETAAIRTRPHQKGGEMGRMERETGLESATFSLEGLDLSAVWLPSWRGQHFVSSYRLVRPGQFM
jgi:hypothetical protein